MANVTVCVDPIPTGGHAGSMTINGVDAPPGGSAPEGAPGFAFNGSSGTVSVAVTVDLIARTVTFVVTEDGTTLSAIDKPLVPSGAATCADL